MSDEDDAPYALRPTETVCACHNLAYHRALGRCPITAEDAR